MSAPRGFPQRQLAIAVPTYNERDNVGEVIHELKRILPLVRIVVVDDSSPDGTAQVIKDLQTSVQGLELVSRPKKTGLASAYFEAFARILADANIEYVVTMDADHSHDPKDLPGLLAHAAEYDLVVGSRYVPGGRTQDWGLGRRALSRFGNLYARFVSGVPISDLTAGYVVYRRALLEELLLNGVTSEGYGFQIEMKFFAHRRLAKIKEAPITFVDRSRGRSKLGKGSVWEGIVMPWHLRFRHARISSARPL
jgi:dolichol-phosphate mannosyltransferase